MLNFVLAARLLKGISLLLGLYLFVGCSGKRLPEASLRIFNVHVVDVEAQSVKGPCEVIIDGDSIVHVSAPGETANYKADVEWDAFGGYIIPGLWDMHVHPDDPEMWRIEPDRTSKDLLMPLFVLYGVTGIRDMGGSLEEVKRWRKARENSSLLCPEIYAAGPLLDGPEPMWDGSVGIRGPEDVPRVVDSLVNAGVDFLKVYSLLPADIYEALSEYAKVKEIPFVGHVPFQVTASQAARTGMKSQEHLLEILKEVAKPVSDSLKILLDKETDPIARYTMVTNYRLDHINMSVLDSVIDVFVKQETWQCPTLSMWFKNAWYEEELEKDQELLNMLPVYMRSYWSVDENDHLKNRDREDFIGVKRELYDFYAFLTARMHAKGVKLLAGTDTGANPLCFPGVGVHNELAALVKAGLTPGEALQTATINPAIFLGIDAFQGKIKQGYKANLVVLVNNPLENIQYTRNITTVITEGKVLGAKEIKEMRSSIVREQEGL